MNKYLLMSAAATMALAANTAPVQAAAGSALINLGGNSNGFTLHWSKRLYAAEVSSSFCAGIGPENPRKSKEGIGIAEGILDRMGYTNTAVVLELSTPLKNGGQWQIVYTTNGSSAAVLNSGSYTVGKAGRGTGTKLSDLIKDFRAAR